MLEFLLFFLPALYLGWTLGGNDAANVFGPAVTTGAVRFLMAALLAGLFVLAGALLQSQNVMGTYGALASQTPVTAALLSLGAAVSVTAFLVLGLPTSVTQTVVGALVGLTVAQGGLAAVEWPLLARLLVAWTLAPVGAGLLAYVLYRLSTRWLESYLRGLDTYDRIMALGFLVMSAYGAYSLGANNVANITGVYVEAGMLTPLTGALLGAAGIALGMLTGSRRVIRTVGFELTSLTSFSGLVILTTEGLVLHLYAMAGVPVSASQAVIGGIIGVGLAHSGRMNWSKLARIGVAWVSAPIAAGILAALLSRLI